MAYIGNRKTLGTRIIEGSAILTPRGAYKATATYEPLDIVEYEGSSYLVLQRVTGVTPTENDCYTLLANKGEDGKQGDSVFIRYSYYADGTDFTETWDGQDFIGFATGQTAPTDKSEYTWALFIDRNDNTNQYQMMFANSLVGKAQGAMVSMDDVAQNAFAIVNPRSKNLLQTINGTYDNDSLNHYKITVENGHYEVETKAVETWAEMREFWTQMGTITLTEGTYRLSRYNDTFNTSYGQDMAFLTVAGTNESVAFIGRYGTHSIFTITEPVTVVVTLYTYTQDEVITYPYTYSFDLTLTKGTEEEDFIPSVPKGTVVPVKSCGKNLIPYPYAEITKTDNGITFTDNGDGSITINGTATANTTFRIIDGWADVNKRIKLQNDSFLSGVLTGASGYYIEAYTTDDNEGEFFPADKGNGETLKAGQTLVYAYLIVSSGTTFNNVTVYPQIEAGTVATPYEPYIEGETIETTMGSDNINVLSPIAPNMTITTDNNGVILDVEYKRDTNIAFEKLEKRLLSLETAIATT